MLFTTPVGKTCDELYKRPLEKFVEQCAFFMGVSSYHENGATAQ